MAYSLPFVAIVPAAGSASRFGSQKLLADLHGEPLINHTLRSLLDAGIARAIVVVASAGALDAASFMGDPRVTTLVNPDPSRGMFSSIQIAVDSVPDATLVVLPADMPFVKSATVRALQAAFMRREAVTVPVYKGKRGHPVLIPSRFQPFIAMADPNLSLKEVLLRLETVPVELEVSDSGVSKDVDVTADLDPSAW